MQAANLFMSGGKRKKKGKKKLKSYLCFEFLQRPVQFVSVLGETGPIYFCPRRGRPVVAFAEASASAVLPTRAAVLGVSGDSSRTAQEARRFAAAGVRRKEKMRAVVQRVLSASVEVEGRVVSAIGPGLLVLVGIHEADTDSDADYIRTVALAPLGAWLTPQRRYGIPHMIVMQRNFEALLDGIFGAMMKAPLRLFSK